MNANAFVSNAAKWFIMRSESLGQKSHAFGAKITHIPALMHVLGHEIQISAHARFSEAAPGTDLAVQTVLLTPPRTFKCVYARDAMRDV